MKLTRADAMDGLVEQFKSDDEIMNTPVSCLRVGWIEEGARIEVTFVECLRMIGEDDWSKRQFTDGILEVFVDTTAQQRRQAAADDNEDDDDG